MKRFLIVLCSVLIVFGAQAQKKTNTIVNMWEYSAPNAPYGYQEGVFHIMEENGKLKGEVIIQQSRVSIPEITKVNNEYRCSFYIDGQAMDVSMKQKSKIQLEGQALGGGMEIPFTCKPVKKEK